MSEEMVEEKEVLPHEHKKTWGKEIWFENNELYCGKLLCIYSEGWSSGGNFHYHKIKDETFYIICGSLRLDVEIDGTIRSLILETGSSFRVKSGVKHRFKSASPSNACEFIEVSTTHRDDDSYRCYWDHNEQKWVDV